MSRPNTSQGQRWVVVGGGVLGAAVARHGARQGAQVTLLESAPALGGLAASQILRTSTGDVRCDRFYHVVCTRDRRTRDWLAELDLEHEIRWRTVASTCVLNGVAYPASSAGDLARLPFLTAGAKLRTAAAVAAGAALPRGPWFSQVTAQRWLNAVAGDGATRGFWEPLLAAKLGPYAPEVSAEFLQSTFRRLALARFDGRDGDRFGVVPGGYGRILSAASEQLVSLGVDVRTGARATSVARAAEDSVAVSWSESAAGGRRDIEDNVDRVIVTTPAPITAHLAPGLTPREKRRLTTVPYLGVIDTTVLLTRAPDPAYLTYIVDRDVPLTSVIGMHALVPPEETGGYHLVHLPRYVAPDDPLLDSTDERLCELALDGLLRVYPGAARSDVAGWAVQRARHVMPVPLVGYRQRVPAFNTSIPGLLTIGSAQLTDGTLNVDSCLRLMDGAFPAQG